MAADLSERWPARRAVGAGGAGERARCGRDRPRCGRARARRCAPVKFGRAWSAGRSRRAARLGGEEGARVAPRRSRIAAASGRRASRSALRRAVCAAVPRGRVYRSPLRRRARRASRGSASRAARGRCRRRSGRTPRLATPSSGASARPCTRTTKMPLAAGSRVREAQVQRAKAVAAPRRARAELAAELAPWTTWPLML